MRTAEVAAGALAAVSRADAAVRIVAALVLGVLLLAPTAALAQAAPAPFTTFYRYDGMRRLVGTIAPDPDGAGPLHYPAVRNSYDDAGRLVRVEKGELAAWQDETVAPKDWAGFTVLESADTAYDMLDRPVTQAAMSPAGPLILTQTSYDAVGRVDCVAVRMNPATWSTLPASACTLTAQGPDGPDRITHDVWDDAGQLLKVQKAYATPLQQDYATYDYTPNGKQKAVTDANGNRAEMSWDGHDRQARWTFPSPVPPQPGQAGTANAADYEEYGYDANGNRTSLRKRDGVTIAYAYDALNRVVQKIVPASASGAAGYAVVYGYDNRGLETSARFGADTGPGVTDSYDNAGRLVAATTTMDGAARTLNATYDPDGNRTGLTGPWGYTAGFAYDGLDRLWGTSESGYATTQLTYDAAGRRSALASGFGTMTSSASSLYDAAGRLQVHAHDLAGTAADQSVTFGYNPASRITSEARANEAYASNTAYNVNRSYAANGLNQYTTAGSAQLAYDANGNLAASPAGDGGTVAYVYDAENRLVRATTSGGTGGTRVVTLAYDPNGRLWQLAAPSGTTRFVYDGDQILIEADGAGNLLRAYVHGTAEDEPLVWYEALPGGASRRFLHADHQGSIVAVADEWGNPLAINAYDPWGIPNAGNQGRFGYTGQAWLPELGMWYYKARIYSPTLGRFLQTDPIGYKDQVNLYAYVGDDPVDRRDPTAEVIYGPEDREQRKMVESNINARAAGTGFRYAFTGKDNHLSRQAEAGSRGLTGSRIGTSPYYSRRLDEAIRSDKSVTIRVQETITDDHGNPVSIDRTFGGGVTLADEGGNATVYVSGNSVIGTPAGGKPMLLEASSILAHELLGHGIPRVAGSDTGNAIANENKMRREAGLPLRPADPGHLEWAPN